MNYLRCFTLEASSEFLAGKSIRTLLTGCNFCRLRSNEDGSTLEMLLSLWTVDMYTNGDYFNTFDGYVKESGKT